MNKIEFEKLCIGHVISVMSWEEIKKIPGADLQVGTWSEWITINDGTFAVTKTIKDYFCNKEVVIAGIEDAAIIVENGGCEFYIPVEILKQSV